MSSSDSSRPCSSRGSTMVPPPLMVRMPRMPATTSAVLGPTTRYIRVTTSNTNAVASTTRAETVHTSSEILIFFSFRANQKTRGKSLQRAQALTVEAPHVGDARFEPRHDYLGTERNRLRLFRARGRGFARAALHVANLARSALANGQGERGQC